MIPSEYLGPFIVSNLFSLSLFLAAFKWPRAVRALFVIIFIGGGFFNTYTALTNPQSYITFGELAVFGFYRDFINGFFSEHVQAIVLMIAAGQISTAILLTQRDRALRLGVLGGIIFLIAIIPLGFGSAFPSTLLMAAGLYVSYRKLGGAKREEHRGAVPSY